METRKLLNTLCCAYVVMIAIAIIVTAMTLYMILQYNKAIKQYQDRVDDLTEQVERKDRAWAGAANQLTRCRETQHAQMIRVRPQ